MGHERAENAEQQAEQERQRAENAERQAEQERRQREQLIEWLRSQGIDPGELPDESNYLALMVAGNRVSTIDPLDN